MLIINNLCWAKKWKNKLVTFRIGAWKRDFNKRGGASVGASYRRVGECLYQNPSSGTYYAVVRLNGKQFKTSLETKSLPEARRKLRDHRKDLSRIDPALCRLTVGELCDKYLGTVNHQAPVAAGSVGGAHRPEAPEQGKALMWAKWQ
jgi:hypothetical protein